MTSWSRRRLLAAGAAGMGVGAVAGAGLARTGSTEPPGPAGPGDDGNAIDGSAGPPSPPEPIAFRGAHQGAIAAPAAAAGVVAGLDVVGTDRRALSDLLARTSEEIERVMAGRPAPARPAGFPAADTGVVGPGGSAGTGVVVGVGASLFDDRFGLAERRPPELTAMPRFANDGSVTEAASHGDLSLAVVGPSTEAVVHAVRQVLGAARDRVRVRWMRHGSNLLVAAGPGRAPGRNLLGFKDGTANPDPGDEGAMARSVWSPAGDEPAWMAGGSYQVIRIIRMLVDDWDAIPLAEQEAIIGRHRGSGAPLGGRSETDVADLSGDPDSHIARANLRGSGTEPHPMLRRSLNYAAGVDDAGRLDQGLVFTCYQRSLRDGFSAVQRRLDGEPLEEYLRPTGGGFFYALPGPGPTGFLGEALVT